jgi:Transposase DDE domain group 1
MSVPPAWPQVLDFFGTPLVIEPSRGQLSGDAGLLPIRQYDHRIGLTRSFAEALDDPRDADLTEHTFLEMVRSRVYGILAGYKDQNDHDTLRTDPVFKLLADRSPEYADLASQPTLSRFENAISIKSLKRLPEVFLDQFIASFDTPPRHLTFDLDAVDDPAHGCQQLTFWHAYYDQNQYLPLVLTCADNDQFVMLSLRHGSAHAALGADDDVAYLVTRLRQVWPDVVLHFRGDCAFGVPDLYDVCERFRVYYTFGLTANAVVQRETAGLLAKAVAAYERERLAARQQEPPRPAMPSRLFTGFWYQAGTWPCARFVVAKAEANDQGTNRRFVVTNRPGAALLPGPTYDDYACRGESENRNKEFKCDLAMDRLSDHRFMANYFRLYLHAAAMNLLVRLRRFIAEPLPALPTQAETASPTSQPGEPALQADESCVPAEALTGAARQRHFRLRRQRDPLGEGHPCTWRTLLIKVAAEVVVRTRRIVVRLSSSWPHLGWYLRVCERLRNPLPTPVPDPCG